MFIKLSYLGGGLYGLPVVGSPLRGNKGYTDPNGTQHSPAIFKLWSIEKLNAIGIAPFVDMPFDKSRLGSSEQADDIASGIVTRTHTTAFREISVLKGALVREASQKADRVAQGGITFGGKDVATDNGIMTDINLIFNMLNSGEVFPGGLLQWVELDGTTFDATAVQFLAFCKAIAAHRLKARKAGQAHIAAIQALSTAQEVSDYDINSVISGSEWPANPIVGV